MQIRFLIDSSQRATGAMFMAPLKDELLVFVYPSPAARLFHTFFCPRLRIIALAEDGRFLSDQVVSPNRFARLPACRIVLETDPLVKVEPHLESILEIVKRGFDLPQLGAWQAGVRVDSLIFALLAEAVADLRRVKDAQQRGLALEDMRGRFEAWERGQLASSAGFILDFSRGYSVPPGALRLSRSLLNAEEPHLDELFAAAMAGRPWQNELGRECLRCGRGGLWRLALQVPEDTPAELAWRSLRPENAVALCHRCADTLEIHRRPETVIELAWGLWGPRFEALNRWQHALASGQLPRWDKLAHPLWPPEYGGETWETGSGALEHAAPRGPQGVLRSPAQLETLQRVLFSKRMLQRHRANSPARRLVELEEIPSPGGDR